VAKQIGVTDIVTGRPQGDDGPAWDYLPLFQLKKKIEGVGLRLSVIESIHVTDKIKLGLAGRDEDIDHFCQSLRTMGAVGVPILCYNFMAVHGWMRTSFNIPGRGGALVSGYDHALMEDAPLTQYGEVDEDSMWDNLEYFLKRIVPVAEEANVKLAMHPDDPPLSPLRGIPRLMRSVDNFKRLIEMAPSPNNGLTFCQGNFAAMGADVPAAIRYFGERNKIFFSHFRDVEGVVPKFNEVFHDEGPTDMPETMRAYRDVGFDGPIRPDHAPILEGETDDHPGYTLGGKIYAIGYMKGILDTLDSQG
jgi:mannonate dehydratase